MKKIYCWVCAVIVLWMGVSLSASASTKGIEFWYAHVDVTLYYQTTGTTRCYLYIYAEHPTTVQALPGLTTLILPRDVINTGLFVTHGYGVHITAEDSVNIVAHIGNNLIDQNGPSHKEAALLLPVSALGYEYYYAVSSKVTHGFNGYGSTFKWSDK